MKYYIKVIDNDNSCYHLSVRGKTSWCFRTAKKHAEEYFANVGLRIVVEDAFGDPKVSIGF